MSVRRSLISLVLLAGATAVALACGDSSPVGVELPTPSLQRGRPPVIIKPSGLVACTQTYDSASKVIGPAGGMLAVGSHILWVDSMALADTVTITAVAPADTVRWVRFEPDGLQFRTNGAGWSAVLYTSYKDCAVPSGDMLRIAQVTHELDIIEYLQTYVQIRRKPWSRGNQYIAGVLNHFSQYAVAW